ncbi:MAG TPA: aminopeptidase P N-terminal domain-containing protein [Burkholderiaceae bacterium]|nr:aminopeptidase P N-terminal domain-containing protein [Burkholderiaceae bacterium]
MDTTTPVSFDVHAMRRARVVEALRELGGGVAVLLTAPTRTRNRDSEYPYRYDSAFWWLTGFGEPESAIVIVVTPDRAYTTLFCQEKDVERELWEGARLGVEAAAATLGVDLALPIDMLDEELPKVLAYAPALFIPFGSESALEAQAQQWIASVRSLHRHATPPAVIRDLSPILDELRLVKDAHELSIMRAAGSISADAHRRAMRATRAGRFEYEIEAELLYEFRRRGAQAPAYTPIVAAGVAACTLHYVANNAVLRDGDLLLVDAGCELDGYASDITRTWPINGRYTAAQRALYELVLAAQTAAIACIAPGRRYDEAHRAAVRTLTQGLLDLGVLKGSLDDLIESKAYGRFYMHGTGHWLGLDVHDVGDYRVPGSGPGRDGERPSRPLVPGMTMTVEPGLYVRAADDVPERFHDIGIRIEDDVVVTATGCELLTRGVPVEPGEIERLVRD